MQIIDQILKIRINGPRFNQIYYCFMFLSHCALTSTKLSNSRMALYQTLKNYNGKRERLITLTLMVSSLNWGCHI